METRQDIIDYLVRQSDGQWTEQKLEKMDAYELLDTYFKWEGLIGFTNDIIAVVKASGVLNQ